MKTIKYKIIVFVLIISNCSLYAQYDGGDADGSFSETLSLNSCSIPASFFPYFGGDADTATVDNLLNTTCPFSNNFYAYFGGDGDGSSVETLESQICGFPPQFFTYFGGDNDGAVVDATAPICPTQPPVASFTASATAICVGQSVTFTDTSTNIPFVWNWTITGATPSVSAVQNPTFAFNTPGLYTVVFKATNYNGIDTATFTDYITVTAIPVVNTTTPGSRCDAGTVTLGATASSGTLNWYDAPTNGNLVGTGISFTTPSITANTIYYVETANGTCISSRIAVTATVNLTPALTGTTPAVRCDSGNISLQATANSGTIRWYDLPTNGTLLATGGTLNLISLSATTTYYVEVTTGLCTSPRTPVIATINVVPSITSTSPATRCNSGTVTLQAAASSGTINWYSAPSAGTLVGTGASFTTPSIAISTTYYVETTSGICASVRTAVTATVSVTSPPTATANQTFCSSETVELIAVTPFGPSIIWYDAPTGGNVVPNNTTLVSGAIYYASQTISGCESTSRTAVTMTLGGCLGTEDFKMNVIKLYPNPVIDLVTISSNETITKIEVVNMLGQLIFANAINEIETKVDLSRYPSGTYLIRVQAEDNKINTFKVLKK